MKKITALLALFCIVASPAFAATSKVERNSVAPNGGTITNATITPVYSTAVTLTDGATPALNAALGNTFILVAGGDRTIAVPSNAPAAGKSQTIVIAHTASGGARTLALNTGAGGFRFGSDVTALTQTASGKTDYVTAKWNAADSKWDVVAVVKGY